MRLFYTYQEIYTINGKVIDYCKAGTYICLLVLSPFFNSLGVEDACYIAGKVIYGGIIGKQFAKYLINLTEYEFDEYFQPIFWEKPTRNSYLVIEPYDDHFQSSCSIFYSIKSACEREEQKRREEQAQEKERQTREEERSIYHSKDFF